MRRSNVFRVVVVATLLSAASIPGLAQASHQSVPPSDPAAELADALHAVQAARQEAGRLASEGEHDRAIALLESIYFDAIDISPSIGARVASQLARAHERNGSAEASHEWYTLALDLQEAGAPNGRGALLILDDAMLLAQSLSARGDAERAVAAFERAARAADRVPEGRIDPYRAYQAWYQLALEQETLGRTEDVARALARAEDHLWASERATGNEKAMMALLKIDSGTDLERDSRPYMEAMIDAYQDERYADVPQIIGLVGRVAATGAYHLRDLETHERLSRDIFERATRFRREMSAEDARAAHIELAYTQAAVELSWLYYLERRYMEAAETTEHALHAYPDGRYTRFLEEHQEMAYDKLGLTEEQREARRTRTRASADDAEPIVRASPVATRSARDPVFAPVGGPPATADAGREPDSHASDSSSPEEQNARAAPNIAIPVLLGVGVVGIFVLAWRLGRPAPAA